MTATVAIAPVNEAPKAAKSPKKKGAKAATAKPLHPPTAQMVNEAVKSLKDRKGSSLQAIKKYISATYKLDAEKSAIYIKKYLKSAVAAGTLEQTKGSGAAGSFKLPSAEAKKKKPTKAGGPAKSPSKKSSPKKKAAVKKAPKQAKAAVKKPAVAKAEKKPTKAKTAKKPPTTPKAPKPKKSIKSAAKAVAKKPAPSKKAGAKKTTPKKK